MHPTDQEKTYFITDKGLYCYLVMLFGLKNAGSTYQRLVNAVFKSQFGRSMDEHLRDVAETFDTLDRYDMKLNPAKCAFRVSLRRFLGFMVSKRGIEANPEKIQAVLRLRAPTNRKELQRLTGQVMVLNRFISQSPDRCLPLFRILMKTFLWDEECTCPLKALKEYLALPLILNRHVLGELLYVYLAVNEYSVSSVLV